MIIVYPSLNAIQNDKTGKSTTRSIYIDLRSGDTIAIICTDWSDEMKNIDGLTIAIDSKEFAKENKLGMWTMKFQYPWDFRKSL